MDLREDWRAEWVLGMQVRVRALAKRVRGSGFHPNPQRPSREENKEAKIFLKKLNK